MAEPTPSLHGRRVAVVTGAAGQIGRCLMAELEQRGFAVVGIDLPAACPEGDPRFLPCDLTDDDQVRATFDTLAGRTDAVHLLVHSAGLSAIGGFADHDLAVHRRVMAVTHFAAVGCTQAALPLLRRARGRVVLIGSVAGFAPVLGRPAYVAAKHAATGLFTALRPELAADGIGVTIAHPTFVTGGMAEASDRRPGVGRATTGEELTPEEVARAVADGALAGRPLVLIGRTARLAWLVNRLSPTLYATLMVRRLRAGTGGDA